MPQDELKALIKKRAALKQRQTLFKTYLDKVYDVISQSDLSVIEKTTFIELETRLERQQNVLHEFDDIQLLIEAELDGDELDSQLIERETFENTYFSLLSKAKEIISDYFTSQQTSVQSNSGSVKSNDNVRVPNTKLPEIKLPCFSGSYDSWLEFRDTFDSLINKNNTLDDIQRFHYLRSCVQGSAAQIIRAIEFSASNYKAAWDCLLARFNNESVLVYNHVKNIFDIQGMTQESATELRRMLDIVSKHLRSLESLGQPVDAWDTLLIYMLTNKLDKKTAREWEEKRVKLSRKSNVSSDINSGVHMQSNLPSLGDFKLFIQQKADLLETMSLTSEKLGKQKQNATTHAFHQNSNNIN